MAGIIFRACGFPSSSPSRSYVYCTDRMSFRFPGLHFLLLGVYEPQGITYCCLWSRNIFFSVAHVWYLSVRTCNQFREIAAHLFWLEFFLQKNGYRITGQKSSDLTLLVFCTLQPCLLYPPPVYFNKVFRSLKIRSFKETIPVGKLNTSSGNLTEEIYFGRGHCENVEWSRYGVYLEGVRNQKKEIKMRDLCDSFL